MRNDLAERLLSLFTSPDRAEAIVGDLAEESGRRGGMRFWIHVGSITLSLCRNIFAEAPWRLARLFLNGATMFTAPALAGTVSVGLFPHLLGSAVNWVTLSIFWWGGAFWAGSALVSLDPRRGMVACGLLALVIEVLSITLAAAAGAETLQPVPLIFFVVALGVAIPLVAGGAFARRRSVAVLAVIFLTVGIPSASAQPDEWGDPSPHVIRSVTVDANVQLEVLDWGGSGPALVLLPGLGVTAHQYDDLAQNLTSHHRVVAVTRRGHRGSSAPSAGYTFDRLTEDVVSVIDTLSLEKPVVVGHSFAGEEMHVLGSRHSQKVRGLVYVDAAFNRGDDADSEAYRAVARLVPSAPPPTAADLRSFASLRVYFEKYGGAGPEGFLRTRYRTNTDGTVGPWAPEPPVRQAMTSAMQAAYRSYNPDRIRVPALAIYAVPTSADDMMRRGSSDRLAFPDLVARTVDAAALREQVEKLYALTRERVTNHEKWFSAFAEKPRIVELSGTHDLISSNPRGVLEQIEAFMSSIDDRR